MQIPVQLVFHGIEKSDVLEALARERVAWLEQFCDEITSCRVLIDEPHHRHRHGNAVHVHLRLRLPGEEIIIGHEPGHGRRGDVSTAVRDAFDAARRRLEEYARRRRRAPRWSVGAVADTFVNDGFGFIRAHDDHRVYFHRNSVERNRFAQLRPGTLVCFVEEEATEQGPKAAVVRVLAPQGGGNGNPPTLPKNRRVGTW